MVVIEFKVIGRGKSMNYLNKLDLLVFIILIYLSLFNGFMISMFAQLNTSWRFYGYLFFIVCMLLIFILIYLIRVSRFRGVFDERIYCWREIFWNASMLMAFLVLIIAYHSLIPFEASFLTSLFIFIVFSVIVYLVRYLALSKPIPSMLDRIVIWVFIGIIYTMIWVFILLTVFNTIIIMPSILRVLGIHRVEMFIAEEMAKNVATNRYTPFALLLIAIFITAYELYKARSLQH